MGLDKYMMTCTHHYRLLQNSFAALKVPCNCLSPSSHWIQVGEGWSVQLSSSQDDKGLGLEVVRGRRGSPGN